MLAVIVREGTCVMPRFVREVVGAAVVGWLLLVLLGSALILSSEGSLGGCLLVAAASLAMVLAWAGPTAGLNYFLRSRPMWTRTASGFVVAAALVAVPVAKALLTYHKWEGSSPTSMALLVAIAFPFCVAVVLVAVQVAVTRAPTRSTLRPQHGIARSSA